MISLTPTASTKVKEIMGMQNPVPTALRVAVVGGGCSGFQYHMAFENQTNDSDEVVDFNGISLRLVHYCLENDIPYESSVPLDRFKDAKGDLDDVKLIKAFNDDKAPLIFKPKAPIPADAVTGSASGLDPHISPASAQAQAARVAKARGISLDQASQLVARFTERPDLGVLGEPRVNVLKLNLELDQQFPRK